MKSEIATIPTNQTHESEQTLKNPSISFVFMEHSDENMERIFAKVAELEPDIVAFESFGGSKEGKNNIAEFLTDITSADADPEMILELSEIIKDDNVPDSFRVRAILKYLIGSDVKFEWIDVSKDDKGYAAGEWDRWAMDRLLEKIAQRSDPADIRSSFDTYIELAALADTDREVLMASQIRQIVHNNPGKKIVTLMGAAHTPVSHMLKDLSTDRLFIGSKEAEGQLAKTEKHRYPPLDRLVRAKKLGKKIREETIGGVIDKISGDG